MTIQDIKNVIRTQCDPNVQKGINPKFYAFWNKLNHMGALNTNWDFPPSNIDDVHDVPYEVATELITEFNNIMESFNQNKD